MSPPLLLLSSSPGLHLHKVGNELLGLGIEIHKPDAHPCRESAVIGSGIRPYHDSADVKPVRDPRQCESQPNALVQGERLPRPHEDPAAADVSGVGREELSLRPVANLDFSFGPRFLASFFHPSGLPQNSQSPMED